MTVLVLQSTYDNLKKEFKDFRNMHDEIQAKVESEKKLLAGQNARELQYHTTIVVRRN
jgi:hypothetical protein